MRSLTQILRNWSYKHRLFYWAFFLCNQFLRTHVVPFVKDIRARFYYIVKRKRTASKNIFPILTFEPTNICNANCVFCAYSKIKDVKSVLSFELFQK